MRLNYEWITRRSWCKTSITFEEMVELQNKEDKDKVDYIYSEIDKRIKKVNDKLKLIWELSYEIDLINEDIIGCIREDLTCSDANIFGSSMNTNKVLDNTWRYFWAKEKNDFSSLENLDDMKFDYEFCLRTIQSKILQNKKCKLIEIRNYNYGQSFEFEYKLGKLSIHLYLPNFIIADKKNYMEYINNPYYLSILKNDVPEIVYKTKDWHTLHDEIEKVVEKENKK